MAKLFVLALALVMLPTTTSAAPAKKATAGKSPPVFVFMDQSTDAPRTMTSLGDGSCSTTKGTFSCMQFGGQLAGQRMTFVDVSFYNDRLYRVMGSAKKWAFPELLSAFTAKYGKPTIRTEKWQNKMGATFDNTVAVWKFKGGELELRELGSRIDDTDFLFLHPGNAPPAEPAKVDF